MRLASGTKLGTYEVLALLGAGGMGEVYRARDTRLGRDVAIKVLPADRLADEDRRRRFVQEAQAASALNHPHIITIHGIESADGHDFIVMEYVRGKSLDALIPRQGMRLAEVLRIAIPVADAVAAAHARGIIHRDLKPANVIVGTDGPVKVLDFGLAKLTAHDANPEEHTVTHVVDPTVSVPGTVVGTAAYMSPEQATGGKVDARSDIFAFGAMLYEMVTGARAFPGGSTTETLTAVLRAEPKRPSALTSGVPLDLEKVMLRCLRKDPARRFQHIDDVNVALHEIKEDSESDAGLAVLPRRRGRSRVTLVVAGAVILMTGIAGWLLRRPSLTKPRPVQVVSLTSLPGHERWPTFSPDGTQVAFEWDGEHSDNPDIYIKMVGSSDVRRLTTNPGGDRAPRWSPDGRQIAYVRDGPESDGNRIHLVSPIGGSDQKLNDVPVLGPVEWSPDSRYLAALVPRKGIYLIPVQGGEPRPITTANPPRSDGAPAFSPDGRRLAYASCGTSGCGVYVLELGTAFTPTSPPRRLTSSGSSGTPFIGSLAWVRDGGSIVYSAVSAPYVTYLWRVELEGNQPPERIEVAGLGADTPVTAPSVDRLAFARTVGDTDVYRFQPGRSSQPVVASTFPDMETRFSPDGLRLAFCSMRSGDAAEVWLAAADGSNAQQLTRLSGIQKGSPWWSPDGRRIAFDSFTDGHTHIWIIDADGGTPHQLTQDPGDQNVPYWSRDGRWIYFSADHGTGLDIWRVLAAGGPLEQVTHGGSGKFACESRDGKSLLYQPKDADSPLLVLPLSGGPPRQLVGCVKPTAFATGPQGVYYVACDSSPDPALHVIDPETGRDRVLGRLEQYQNDPDVLPLGLAVSPDGMSILYLRHMRDTSDLMLIENFR